MHHAKPIRDVLFVASSGHELGHLGLDAFIERRPGLVPAAKAWIHLGANIGAAHGPGNNLQASDDETESMMAEAMTKAGLRIDRRLPRGAAAWRSRKRPPPGRAVYLHHRKQRPLSQYKRSSGGRGRSERHRIFRQGTYDGHDIPRQRMTCTRRPDCGVSMSKSALLKGISKRLPLGVIRYRSLGAENRFMSATPRKLTQSQSLGACTNQDGRGRSSIRWHRAPHGRTETTQWTVTGRSWRGCFG